MHSAWLAILQRSRNPHLPSGWATGDRDGSPILLVSRVTVGTAAVSTKEAEVGEGADAAGEAARPTAILSCTATSNSSLCLSLNPDARTEDLAPLHSLLLSAAARQACFEQSRGLHGYRATVSTGCRAGLSAAPQHACKVLSLRDMH